MLFRREWCVLVDQWKKKITLVWMGQSISLLTSSTMQISLIWYLTLRTESASIITLATIAGFLPQGLLGPFVGPVIDRFQKKSVIMCADMFVALGSLILAFFASRGELPIPLILFILVFRAVGTAFHEPTAYALTPLLVPEEELVTYSGFAQAFETVSMLLCPGLAVILYEIWPLEWIFYLDVLGAMVAVAFLFFVQIPLEEIPEKSEKKIQFWQETKEALGVLKEISGVFPLMLVGAFYTMLYSPVGSLYPLVTMVHFEGTTSQSAFVEVVFSCGTMLGALALGKFGKYVPNFLGMFGSMFLYGLGAFSIGGFSSEGYWLFVGVSFVMGCGTPWYHGISASFYQKKVPSAYLGRTFALAQSVRRLGMPLGLLLGGAVADTFGVSQLYQGAGILAMTLAMGGYFFFRKGNF